MSGHVDTERILDAFLAPEHDQLAEHVLEASFADIARTPQRPALRVPWRFPIMPALSRATGLAAVALVAVVGAGGIFYLASAGAGGGTPSPGPTSTPAPTVRPTVSRTIDPSELDTNLWTPYTSTVYGFPMGYPADWTLHARASRSWTPADGFDWSAPGLDTFSSPNGDIAVSVWGVAVDPNLDPSVASSWGQFEGWIETFCTQTGNEPCTGIHLRVVPMCPDSDTECHTGAMIVPFKDNVTGFKGGDRGGVTTVVDGEEVTYWIVVTVWQPESYSGLDRYGGGARLIQAFLESMGAQMPTRGPVDHSDHPLATG